MPQKKKIVEYVELDREKEWTYLKRFYEVASKFYQIQDKVVSEEEVETCIRSFKEKPSPRIRKELKIKDWRFTLDEEDEGVGKEFYSFEQDESTWEKVSLPHSINHVPKDPVRYGRSRYKVLAREKGMHWDIYVGKYATWYKSRIPVGAVGEGEIATLSFDSVNLLTDVWVNENPVMMGHLGLFPFGMEVTEELNSKEGKEAVIALKVSNQASNTPYLFYNGLQVAYTNSPYLNAAVKNLDDYDEAWSGIAGDATLRILNRRHIEDAFLFTEDIVEGEAELSCRLQLRNASWRRFKGTVQVEISRWLPEEGEAVVAGKQVVEVLPMADATAEIRFTLKDAALWSVDSPNLYLAHVVLVDEEGKAIDDVYESFGVRTIKMRGSHFYLNNRKIVPRGTHDLSNYFGESLICPSDRAIVMDILLHKKMNATCSRWPSDMRMHYRRIAEYADQLGFMISWTGYFEMWLVHPEMELYAQRDAKAMVRSLRNHPSIIVWEMGDEPLMLIHHHRRFRWYEQIYRLVEQEDRSRPIIPAGYWCNELVELIEKHPGKDLAVEERRRQVLEDYPLFGLELAPWDFHHCPYLPGRLIPVHEVIATVKDSLGGQRATIFTEFGIDGMPEFEKVKDVYGKFRWAAPGLMPVDREAKDLNYYGQKVGQEDWRETQAAQAVVLSSIIGHLRENPETFAGFYSVTLVDSWTFYWGLVDANYNAKLAYFVARSCYGSIYISGLHGSTVADKKLPLEISASNFGGPIEKAELKVSVKDDKNREMMERAFSDLSVEGNGAVTLLGELALSDLSPGLYSIEYGLQDHEKGEIAKRLELFYLVEG